MRKTPTETVCTEVKNKNNSWMKRFCFWLFYLDTKKKKKHVFISEKSRLLITTNVIWRKFSPGINMLCKNL